MIYTIGEALVDVIVSDTDHVAVRPGGAMLNTAVSLGRMGVPVSLISEYGKDGVGNMVGEFLEKSGVNTDFVHRYEEGQTALAVALLDKEKRADYTFYKDYPARRLDIAVPMATEKDILLFGSFYSLGEAVRPKIMQLLHVFKASGALVVYDPNIRKASHLSGKDLSEEIRYNILASHIIRASNEDLENIFNTSDPGVLRANDMIPREKILIITRGPDNIELDIQGSVTTFPVPLIDPVSTVGAGDSFNAGLIYAMYRSGVHAGNIYQVDAAGWRDMIMTGIKFAAPTCLSYDNYVPEGFNPDL